MHIPQEQQTSSLDLFSHKLQQEVQVADILLFTMSLKLPTFEISYTSPSSLASATIDVHNINTSTPISIHPADETSLSSIEIGDTHTPTNIRRRKLREVPLHSILKNGPNRTQLQPNTSYYSTISDTPRTQKADMELSLSRNARVLFSPTKEVVSYFADYNNFTVDLTKLDDEGEHSIPRNSSQPRPPIRNQLWTDPSVPYVLLLYLQLLCNIILVSVVIYLIYVLIVNIRADVRHKIDMYTSDAIREITRCSRDFYRNKCSTDGNVRAPALEQVCTKWEKCMNRDPQQIGRSKITAETFADIVNGFFKPISWKSLFMFSTLLFGSFFVTNVAFGSYRKGPIIRKSESAKIEDLQQRIKEQEKQLESRQHVLPATPPSQFVGNDYDPILNDSLISYNSPLMSKRARG